MATPLNPNAFRPSPISALQNAKAVGAAKAQTLAQNTSWLYEAILDRPTPDSPARGAKTHLTHEGQGTGRPLSMAATWPRGFLRDAQTPSLPLLLSGDGNPSAVPQLVPAFRYGPKTAACPFQNVASVTAIPIITSGTLRILRTRLWGRLITGDYPAKLYLAVSLLDEETLPGIQSAAYEISGQTPTLYQLELHLDDPRLRAGTPLLFSIRAEIPRETLLELNDDQTSGAVLGLSSR